MDMSDFLAPVLALIIWTLVVWIILYARRIPAMQAAKIAPDDAKFPGTYADAMPPKARGSADNYNHLMEQPTIFYALMFFAALTGKTHAWVLYLAWAYVALRILHSLVQTSAGPVMARFSLFALSTLCLFGMVGVVLLA